MTGPILPGECIAAIRSIPSPVTTTTALPCLSQNLRLKPSPLKLQNVTAC